MHAQLCLTVYEPTDCNLSGSSVHGIVQARILEWVAISYSRDLPDPVVEPASLASPLLASELFTTSTIWKALDYWMTHVLSTKHCSKD